MNSRFFLKLIFQCLMCATVATAAITGCSTDVGDSEIEDELSDEFDDLADAEDIDGDTTVDASEAEKDGDDVEDSRADDEFLAEDSDTPGDGEDSGIPSSESIASSDDDDMESEKEVEKGAEDDLEKELGKGKVASHEKPAEEDSGYSFQPEPVKEDDDGMSVSSTTVPTMQPPDIPVEPPIDANGPKPAAAGMITSKEATVGTSDGFEYINPGPALPKDDLGVSDPLLSEVDPPLPSLKAAKEVVPIAKVQKNPYFSHERLMNAVYIARPGDDIGTISQKIYNENRAAQLLADNDHLVNGSIEPGDKIYYNSPNRPDDKKAILTYYEDNKMAPSYYTTQEGDDIKKIGRRVLGYEDAWKEVWAVNDGLQTQALMPSGLKIRYWSGNETKSVNDANMAPTAAPETVAQAVPAEVPMDIPPPPMESESINTEDPSMATAAINDPAPILPETSSDSSMSAPAPESGEGSLGTVAGIALVGLAGVALVAMQIKNRKKSSDSGLPPSLEFTKV